MVVALAVTTAILLAIVVADNMINVILRASSEYEYDSVELKSTTTTTTTPTKMASSTLLLTTHQ